MPAKNPTDLHTLFIQGFQKNDLNALLALYEPTATIIPPQGATLTGHEAIRGMLASFLAMKPTFTMKATSIALADNGNIALVRNAWTLDATDPDGKPVHMAANAFEVMRKQPDGTWLYLIDHAFAA